MATRVIDEFGARANPADASYPDGSLKNESAPLANDGSPLEERVGNDYEGLKQPLLAYAGIAPNGQPDSVTNPQQLNAIKFIAQEQAHAGDSNIVGKIWPIDSNRSTINGDNIQSPTSVLRGINTLYSFVPLVYGTISDWNELSNTAKIGGIDVELTGLEFETPTVETLANSNYPVGSTVKTKGYYSLGIGSAKYLNRGQGWPVTADGFVNHADGNGNFYELQHDGITNIEQIGGVGFDGIDAIDFSAQDAGAVINAAWGTEIKLVKLSGLAYPVATEILYKTDKGIVGDSWITSILAATPAFTGNVIDTFDFAQLEIDLPFTVFDGCPTGYVLRDVTVVANKSTYPTTVTKDTGYGLRWYGKQIDIQRVRISEAAGIGALTYVGPNTGVPNFRPIKDSVTSKIADLHITDTGYENFIFRGPNDINLDNIFCGWAANSLVDTVFDPLKESLYYPGDTIDGMVMAAGAEIGYMHCFDNKHGWGFNKRDTGDFSRITARLLMSERSHGNFRFGKNTRYVMTGVVSEENFGDGSRPHIFDDADKGLTCSDLQIFRSNDSDGSCLIANGFRSNWIGRVISNGSSAGHGVEVRGTDNKVDMEVEFCSGTAHDGTDSAGCIFAVNSSRNEVNVKASQCDNSFRFDGSSGVDYLSSGKLVAQNTILTASDSAFVRVFNLAESQYRAFEMHETTTAGLKRENNYFVGSVACDFSSTAPQTLSIPHTLIRFPADDQINVSVSNDSSIGGAIIPPIERCYVSDTSGTNITVVVQFAAGGSGAGFVVARY